MSLNKKIFNIEMWGVLKTFKMVEKIIRQLQQPWTINIFYDTQSITNNLKQYNVGIGQALKLQIYQKAWKLVEQGQSIFIK